MSDSMRDAMSAAFDASEVKDGEEEKTGGSPANASEPLGAATEGEAPGGEAPGEEAPGEELPGKEFPGKEAPGKETPAEEAGAIEPSGKDEGKPEAGEQLPVSADAPGDAPAIGGDTAAPVSWTPAAREHWAAIPPAAQAEIAKRETEINSGLQQAAGHKRVAEEYFRTFQPFQPFIQAAGSTPSQAITELMTTAVQLTQGSPAKKAEVIRNIISEYGVDIGMLDELLAGQELPDDPNAPLLKAIDQRLAPINQFMGGVQRQHQDNVQQTTDEATTELAVFQGAHEEYYEDLREDMADLLEMAANRNRSMTMEEAYEKAAAAHPQIGPILKQRAAAKAGVIGGDAAAAKLAAASSIKGDPNAAGGSTVDPTNTRALMEEAWDDSEGSVGHG